LQEELTIRDRRLTGKEYRDNVASVFAFYPKNIQRLIEFEYRNRFSGPDRYFRALDQMVGDSDFVCNTEALAQAASRAGSNVYRLILSRFIHSSL
jgi:hypothetical protein